MALRWRPVKANIINAPRRDDTISLGRAIVREFVVSTTMDAVVGCYVTQGVIARPAAVRVIREGLRIYPPPGQMARLDVLQEAVSGNDADEIGEGSFCSLHVRGFGAIPGDVVEAYCGTQ